MKNRIANKCCLCLIKGKIRSPKPDKDFDIVGPPDNHSNIRKVVYSKSSNPSPDEEILHAERIKTYQWHNEFWKEHNIKFFKVIYRWLNIFNEEVLYNY